MTIRTTFASLCATAMLAGCGMYGVSYPKPTYDYVGAADDPQITLRSDFGVHTQFRIKLDAAAQDDGCSADLRVPYMQAMDSYFRDPTAKGPWRVAVPADQPLVVSAQWFRYGTELPGYAGRRSGIVHGGPTSCADQALTFVPRAGQAYELHLRDAGGGRCALDLAAADRSAVAATAVRGCRRSAYGLIR